MGEARGVSFCMPFNSSEPGPDVHIHWSLHRAAGAVFNHLTDPAKLPEWLGKPVLVSGSEVRIDHGDGYICDSVILALDAEACHVRLTWKFPDEPETVLSLTVQESAAGSQLVLHHEGLGDLRDSYESGWLTHLSYLEASLQGQPLPPGQFWNLHGTFTAVLRSQRD